MNTRQEANEPVAKILFHLKMRLDIESLKTSETKVKRLEKNEFR